MTRLGSVDFLAGGVASSRVFRPIGGALYITLFARPSTAGNVALFFVDLYSNDEIQQGAAVAVSAGDLESFAITYPVAGGIVGAFLRYTNTSAQAGLCTFSAAAAGSD